MQMGTWWLQYMTRGGLEGTGEEELWVSSHKAPALPIKWPSVTEKWTLTGYKCTLYMLGKPEISSILREERKELYSAQWKCKKEYFKNTTMNTNMLDMKPALWIVTSRVVNIPIKSN